MLLTSANLTGTAFSKRYEVGMWLKGIHSHASIALFELWWNGYSLRLGPEAAAKLAKTRRRGAGENGSGALETLNTLPDDPGDYGGQEVLKLFLDYPDFLRDYRVLTEEYVAYQRIWPNVPIYFELDGFLNFLFRDHPNRPTRPYEKKRPRVLSVSERRRELHHYASSFGLWAKQTSNDGSWRPAHSKVVQRLLSKRNIVSIKRPDIRRVVEGLNCMNDNRQRNRFLQLQNNSTAAIRRSWAELLHGSGPVTDRMTRCANGLFGFKRSSVQELIGFFAPDKYPLRNVTVNAGLRFFGFDVLPH